MRPPCDDCEAFRVCDGHYRRFDPACLYCGARAIQVIQRFKSRPVAERSARCAKVLADWQRLCGHSEADLRRLAALPTWALEPLRDTPGRRKAVKPAK